MDSIGLGFPEVIVILIIVGAFVAVDRFWIKRKGSDIHHKRVASQNTQQSVSEGVSTTRLNPTKPFDPFGGASAEILAKGLGQILEEGEFENFSTKDAKNAATALFDKALPATPSFSIDAVKSQYDVLRGPWCSQNLFEGSRDRIRSVLLANVHRIQSEHGFRGFEISVDMTRGAARIDAIVGSYFVPISVWHSGEIYFACGNSDFAG